jgi:hypothetical protein
MVFVNQIIEFEGESRQEQKQARRQEQSMQAAL